MEGGGKLVEDEELREAMSQRGLGTPATRAQIIEGLLLDGYITRQGRELFVTQKGLSLINLLHGIGIQALTSPEMTGEWEFKLKQMEHGAMPRPEFMDGTPLRRRHCRQGQNFSGDSVQGQFTDLKAKCPRCGAANFKESQGATNAQDAGWSSGKTWPAESSSVMRFEASSKRQRGSARRISSKLGRVHGDQNGWGV